MPSEAVVHVVDDDDAVRHSLEFLLKTAKIKVFSYDSAETFLEKLTAPEGCVVTDIRMPGISGLELMSLMKERHINMPVIVITGHGDVPLAVEAMKLGAADFLEKPFDDDAMLAAISAALSRHQQEGMRTAEKAQITERLTSLTNRERQVLDGLVKGHPNKTIGYDLGISARTVEIYRANVMTKMRASSLSDLVRMTMTADP
jgi:two-component system response regulator FixJ